MNYNSLYDTNNQSNWYQINRYYAMNFDFFEMEAHTHNEFEIMYIASGSCIIYLWPKDMEKEIILLKKGEYILIDSHTKHQLIVEKGTPCRILNMEMQVIYKKFDLKLQTFISQSKSVQNFFKFPIHFFKGYDPTGNLHTIITQLHHQLQNDIDLKEDNIMLNLILAQFLVELSRQRNRKYYSADGSLYTRQAITYIKTHYEQDIKIKDIADEIRISPAYLQRLFKKETGKTLTEKINELRIEKAKILLETSSLAIVDIAISVGFNNRQHFTHTFYKLTGSSPALFRKHKGDHCVWNGFNS